MNRRNFLRTLFGAAAVQAAPTYFLPPIGGWKSDVIVNPNEIAINSLPTLTLPALHMVYYDKRFIQNLKQVIRPMYPEKFVVIPSFHEGDNEGWLEDEG